MIAAKGETCSSMIVDISTTSTTSTTSTNSKIKKNQWTTLLEMKTDLESHCLLRDDFKSVEIAVMAIQITQPMK